MDRYLSETINEFAAKKFVILAGPRQVGKTTLAKHWLSSRRTGEYLNWDAGEDRARILRQDFIVDQEAGVAAVILDEIHKYPRWKNYLKGLCDKHASRLEVLITGSAQPDLNRRAGDSLFGRYELLRLHPLSIGELTHGKIPKPPVNWLTPGKHSGDGAIWDRLRRFGGFPEPYFEQDPLFHRRWSLRRRELLIKEDLRDISEVKLVELVEHLYLLLPDRVGSALSVNSLKEELQVAYNSVATWISVLERLYLCFRLNPYHKNLARSLKKEQKLYFWDWSQIQNDAAAFENMVAMHLLKAMNTWTDLGYGEYALHYWRNKQKQEVDFVVTLDRKPVAIFECKMNDVAISPSLVSLRKEIGDMPAIQLVAARDVDREVAGIRVVSACDYLVNLV